MSFGLSEFDDFEFDFAFPASEFVPFDDSLMSQEDSNALLDGLIALKPASPNCSVSPSLQRKPSASRWVPLNLHLPPISPLPLQPPTVDPRNLQSPLTSSTQREPSRWVPISPLTNIHSRVQSPHMQYQYPDLDIYYGQPQHLANSVPYFAPLPAPAQSNFSQFGTPICSPLMGPSLSLAPMTGRQYQPISPFADQNAPNAEDLALSPVVGFIGTSNPRISARALAPQPTRKRRRSIHDSDLETSDIHSELSSAPSDTLFTGRRPQKGKKLGPPYKYKQTEARKITNKKRKAVYHQSKQDAQSSSDEWHYAPETPQSGKKKGRPYVYPQTKERQARNEYRRWQYQQDRENPAFKAKSNQASKDYYNNVLSKKRKLVEEIENTKGSEAPQGEETNEGSDEIPDDDEEYMPRRPNRQRGAPRRSGR